MLRSTKKNQINRNYNFIRKKSKKKQIFQSNNVIIIHSNTKKITIKDTLLHC